MRKRELSVYRIARQQGITPRYARMLYRRYKGVQGYLIDQIKLQKPGRRSKPIEDYERFVILESYKKIPMCAVKMEKYHHIIGIPRIPHNRIQKILMEANISKPLDKRIKRKKWVRYERYHSNSLWHTDFTETNGRKWIIAYIDDASRKILNKGIFDSATTDNALMVLDGAIRKFGKPKQLMTDHGAQFCSEEERVFRFREELKKRGIEHIMSRVKRPQSNGKIERWFGSLDRLYRHFGYDLDKAVECYNNMPHLSLDTTPNLAYIDKMPEVKEVEYATNKR